MVTTSWDKITSTEASAWDKIDSFPDDATTETMCAIAVASNGVFNRDGDEFTIPGIGPSLDITGFTIRSGNMQYLGGPYLPWMCSFQFQPTITQGSTITSAALVVEKRYHNGVPNLAIYGEDTDSATILADDDLISTRSVTTASASWTPSATGIEVIPITSIIQEIINRSGYVASSSYVAIIIKDNNSSDGHFTRIHVIEGSEAYFDPTLAITATVFTSTKTSWDLIAESTPLWDGYPGVSCISAGYGVGSYGDAPAEYGYGCGGLSCTNIPVKWDLIAKQTTIWDEI